MSLPTSFPAGLGGRASRRVRALGRRPPRSSDAARALARPGTSGRRLQGRRRRGGADRRAGARDPRRARSRSPCGERPAARGAAAPGRARGATRPGSCADARAASGRSARSSAAFSTGSERRVLGVVLLHRRRPLGVPSRQVLGAVDDPDDPAPIRADVEDVDARGRLLEAAEEASLSRQRVREDRPVDAAVEDGERGVPRRVGDELLERGNDSPRELADRLAAEEAGVGADRAREGAGERRLEPVFGDVFEPPRPELLERRPRLGLPPRRDEQRCLDGSRRARS